MVDMIFSCDSLVTETKERYMLDHLLDPDDYPECPKCCAELEIEGDKWEMDIKCSNPECDYEHHIDNLP